MNRPWTEMLKSLLTITVKLLQFRAGPQDFPYSAQMTRTVVLLALLVSYLQYRLTLPPLVAVVHSVATLAVLAGFTWQLLALRKLQARTQQTVNSLFATGSALTLVSLPMLVAIAPYMLKFAEDPQGPAAEALPGLPFIAVMLLSLWSLAVTANIYRHALNVPVFAGVLASVGAAIVSVSLAGFVSGLFLK